jgi:tetratricopeptide (TPR) repeat protein
MTEGTPHAYKAPGAQLRELKSALANRYVIERELGQGGMAVVYRAQDAVEGRTVALKVLRPEMMAAVGAARFLREIAIERRLHHPNILPMFDWGWAGGSLYYTMPCVEGESLRERIRREQQLPLADATAIVRDVAAALDYAHAQGIIHRDIKPANILLAGGGAQVADFGIARAMTAAAGDQLTASGVALGTAEYMSPEQAHAERNVDGRTDLYALGCVLYEMLAGEPPFTGPSVQAVIARHTQAPPPSVRVVRRSLPEGVDRVIAKALAKTPVDRFATGRELVAALEAAAAEGEHKPAQPWSAAARRPGMRAMVLAGIGVLAVAVGAWMIFRPGDDGLDPKRVVVFPLRGGGDPHAGEAVATAITYALSAAPPLRSFDGWHYLDDAARTDVGKQPAQVEGIARRLGARYYIVGSIVQGRADSVSVLLTLQRVGSDSTVVRRASGLAGTGVIPQLGLDAAAMILPSLIAPGRVVDGSALSGRQPTALANFLLGESEYRRMQFASALEHYRAAVREDSTFGLAALKGAQAANWLSHAGDDAAMIDVAMQRVDRLPPMHGMLAKGIHAYVTGSADEAIGHLRSAIRFDSTAVDAWAFLGEVYARTAPSEPRPDSVAHVILQRVRRMAPDFAPALLLLEEMAVRDGRLDEVRALRQELRAAGADTTHAVSRELMLRCVRDGASSIEWDANSRERLQAVLSMAKLVSVRASQPACARAAFESVLAADSATRAQRWGALLGLQSVHLAVGDSPAADSVLESPVAAGMANGVAALRLLDAVAGGEFEQEATSAAARFGTSYPTMPAANLWLLGQWEHSRGNLAALRQITDVARARVDSSAKQTPRAVASAVLLSQSMEARVALLEGDTARAVSMLRALRPSEPRSTLTWGTFEALGAERLLLARLLLANGKPSEAERVAAQLDAAEPVIYLLYLRPSLELRIAAAQRMDDQALAARYERRLAGLGQPAA